VSRARAEAPVPASPNAGAAAGLLAAAALLAGSALGILAAGATALLLYTEQGFLATAGFLISLLFVAAAAGAWVGEPRSERARLAWTGAILAFGIAAAFAAYWGARPALRAAPLGGAAAVLLMVASPAYAAGLLLARLARRGGAAGALALAGIAIGIFVATNWGIPRLEAPFLFLVAAAVLVAAAPLDAAATTPTRGGSMNDRVVVITGVGDEGQVGFALARAFLGAGARVVITDIKATVARLAERLGGDVLAVPADLTDEAEALRVIDAAVERHGRIDVLLNVAGGLSVMKSVERTDAEEWNREIARNATTTFTASRAALPHLRHSRGCIVCFASPAAERGVPGLAAYSAAKAGVAAFARVLAREERGNGVRVNVIAPAMIDTAQNRESAGDDARFVAREEIAAAVFFLTSPEARSISGETLHIG
jgi:NAD(P)-dependent dehydrogenase (short-subunit alcohol dehydrogenase family)